MDVHWTRQAFVHFNGKGQDQLTVEHIDLSGDVDVKNPQLAMTSQSLSLYFKPPEKHPALVGDAPAPLPTTRPAHGDDKPQQELDKVLAWDAVHCELAGQNGKKQTIFCDNLEMRTARSDDGKFYPHVVNTKGHVHAYDSEQDLHAGFVNLLLKPAVPAGKKAAEAAAGSIAAALPKTRAQTRPAEDAVVRAGDPPQTRPADDESDTASVELETMDAWEHVRVVNKEGSIATGSELTVTTENNATHVRLTGSPLLPATRPVW